MANTALPCSYLEVTHDAIRYYKAPPTVWIASNAVQRLFYWLFRLHFTRILFNSLGGGHTHTDVRTKAILILNQLKKTNFKNILRTIFSYTI